MLTRPTIRNLLCKYFPTDPDLHAFCLDYCPESAGRLAEGMERQQKINRLFELFPDADLIARLKRWAQNQKRSLPDLDSTAPVIEGSGEQDGTGDLHLRRVAAACRLSEHPKQIEVVQVLSEPALRLCEVRFYQGRVPVQYGLGFTTNAVDMALLDRFEAALHTYCLDTRGCGLSRLIYHSNPPPTEVEDAAIERYIDLKSLDDYESLVDLTRARRSQAQRLSKDPRYLPGLYVPQRMRFGNGTQFRLDQTSDHALETLSLWLQTPGNRCVLILGEFGTGKTFLLYELARRLQQSGSKQIPLLCNLREIEKAQELDTLLVQHMQREHITPFEPPALRHMIGLGRVVLLFDGFDEMALRTDYERAAHHLEALLAAAVPGTNAKLVLTSRTSHFLTDQEVATVLGQKLSLVPVTVAQLQPFMPSQIERFLENKLGSQEAARARCALLEQVEDLSGLAQNPRMLSMIADLEESRLVEARDRHGSVTEADLYQLLVDQWLDYEVRRKAERAAGKVLDRPLLLRAATYLALLQWQQLAPTLGLDDLREAVRASQPPTGLDIDIAAQQLGSSSLLVRAGEAAFTFLHASLGEFLVARAAADELNEGRPALLQERPISRLATKFLIGCLRPCTLEGPVATWAGHVLAEEEAPSQAARSNAIQVFIELKLKPPTELNLSGQDLSGKDLTGLSLRGAKLQGAALRSVTLVGKDLRRADMQGADLSDADLRRANLQKADLRQAVLCGANLMGADLRGAQLEGVQLRRARLLAAQVDEDSLSRSDMLGAALPNARPMPKLHSDHIENKLRTALRGVTFSPDGRLLSSGTAFGTVRPWSPRTGQPVARWTGHREAISSTAFSPNGTLLASGSWDGTIRLREVSSGKVVSVLSGHQRDILSVAFSPDGNTVASGSLDHTVRLWKVDGGKVPEVLTGHRDGVTGVAFSPDGRTLASSSQDGTVRLWAMVIGEVPRVMPGRGKGVTGVAFAPDGDFLSGGSADGYIQTWRMSSSRREDLLLHQHTAVSSVAYSPDGSILASGAQDGTLVLSWGATRLRLQGHIKEVSGVTFSPDSQILASGSLDGTLRLWRVVDGTCLAVLVALNNEWVAFTPDGQYKMGGDAGSIAQWFWHEAGECRFMPGELDEFSPGLRLPEEHSFF